MIKKSLTVFGVLAVLVLVLSSGARAEQAAQAPSAETVQYNVNASLKDNLKSLAGKRVYVHLSSGTTLSGLVKEVGDHLLHLEKLDGKEYFDALISIGSISAIDIRFRNFRR